MSGDPGKTLRKAKKRFREALAIQLETLDAPLPKPKAKPANLPEGVRPFEHPFYWAAFVLIGDRD